MLESLLDVFWKKGFSRASLDDLEAAAGVNRPSLYTAFGDKQGMYLRALAAFEARMAAALAPALQPALPLREGLRAFYSGAVDLYTADRHAPRGCLVFCTAVTEAVEDEAVREVLRDVLEKLDRALVSRFTQAQAAGELPARAATALGMSASALLHSLALRARAGATRARLLQFVDAGLDVLLGPGSPQRPASRARPRKR